MMEYTGKLIALESEDDRLITEQIEKLYCWLQRRGHWAVKAVQPTNGPAGSQIKLYQGRRLSFSAPCMALLWMADRMDHLNRSGGILSLLGQGHHVLCGRYWLYAYVHLLDQVALDWHEQINALCKKPDLTIYMETQPKKGHLDYRERYQHVITQLTEVGENIVQVDRCSGSAVLDLVCHRSISRLLSGDP
jgi:thymidylate kinase